MKFAIHGSHLGRTLDEMVEGAGRAGEEGFERLWLSQAFGLDALTALAVIGRDTQRIGLGAGVVPVFTRHPEALAASALTVQAATDGRLTLGLGLSHRSVVETRWGYSFDQPLQFMSEYLDCLIPLLRGEASDVRGRRMSSVGGLAVPEAPEPLVLLGALGPQMLRLAGRRTAGTIVGNAGPRAIREHIAPVIRDAAAAAGRDEPRIVANVPVWLTDDPDAVLRTLDADLAAYARFPSFKRALDREGVRSPSEVAVVGDEEGAMERVQQFADAGVTEFVAVEMATDADERARTRAWLRSLPAGKTVEEEAPGADERGAQTRDAPNRRSRSQETRQ